MLAVILIAALAFVPAANTRGAWPAQPNRALTPGAVFPVTAAEVCVPGYSSRVRSVSTATARSVFSAYHVPFADKGKGELDHLIPLELGGSNDATNLWPQFGSRPNRKDGLENSLHARVCNGTITLTQAQRIIIDPAQWPA